jgi:eukaryotic-like serine/threonine-protein kinase
MSNIPQQIGNYLLEREIGRGGSGVVWLARHASLEERRVAVKILTDYNREAILRFQREAAIACRLQHPHIVQVYDHGQDTTVYYTVMEYIHGGSLRLLIEKQGRLAATEAMPILKQIATALDYAHARQVIHRDVSPGNILIEQASGRALLTDFGIARQPDKSITVTHHIMGTPGFASPEHVHSATSVTHLSDVFGLGAVFYFMLSGELPWQDERLPLERVFPAPVPLRERGVTNLPSDIDRVLQTMLANDPAKRFPSAGAAVAELERIFVRHESVTQISTPAAADAGNGKHPAITVVSAGIEQNAVETALGPDLVRAPVARAHQRADDLRRPEFIAGLLNTWAAQSRLKMRRQLLGRMARLHKVSSRNVYYYRLRVLYERREKPVPIEQPDLNAEVFPLEPEVDRWQVPLPPIKDFSPAQGKPVVLPGSTRVVTCANCSGKGKIVCPRCKGRQRIRVPRELVLPDAARRNRPEARSIAAEVTTQAPGNPAAGRRGAAGGAPAPTAGDEPTLVPCPNCDGQGGIRCDRCNGVGRLIQRNVFRWERRQQEFARQDDLPDIDENWLHQNFEANAIYCEQAGAGFRPEWSNVPALRNLITAAQAQADDQNRVVLSEVTIHFIPVSDIVFDLGHYDPNNPDDRGLYKLSIYGFENYIPPDWRFLNWERVIYLCAISFISIIAVIFGIFAII